MVDSVGGYAVFTAKQVGTFYIKLVDVLALILDLAGFLHVDAGHTFEHIAYRTVLLLGETSHIVCYGVTLFAYAVGLHSHLFEQGRARFKLYGERKCGAFEGYGFLGKAHHRHFQTAPCH